MPHYYVIRQGNKSVGIRDNDHSFVIGFRTSTAARHAQYTMHPERTPMLLRNQQYEVSVDRIQDIDKKQSFMFDPAALVRIDKCNPETEACDGGFYLDTVTAADFISMPFRQQVGIIMPSRIKNETNAYIEYVCDLVEPCFDQELFTDTLNKINQNK